MRALSERRSSLTLGEAMAYLDRQAFEGTFTPPMVRLGVEDAPPFDFWPYVDAIPAADYGGFDCSAARVDWVWRSHDGRYQHVLLSAKEDKDVFMAVVLDVSRRSVLGHRLLDLKSEYGMRKSDQ